MQTNSKFQKDKWLPKEVGRHEGWKGDIIKGH